jgi:hypothetical protein
VILDLQHHFYLDESTQNTNEIIKAAVKNKRELSTDGKRSTANSICFNSQWGWRLEASSSGRRASWNSHLEDIAKDTGSGLENAGDKVDR